MAGRVSRPDYGYLNFGLTIILMVAANITNTPTVVRASDPDPLQDFCVADLASAVTVSGYPCKPAELATIEDFAYIGLANAANLTVTLLNSIATSAFVHAWPAVNTLGVGLVCLDINPGGIIMPHTHNLATEILYCLEGDVWRERSTPALSPTAIIMTTICNVSLRGR